MHPLVQQLSPLLFWDVDPHGVDPQKHRRWLLARVLEYGRWEDWCILRKELDSETLRELEPRLNISGRSRSFLRLHIPTPG
jgi:hypothetical protein